MSDMEIVAVLDNQHEARLLDQALDERGIPHIIRSYSDRAYDGVFQLQKGWGDVQAPPSAEEEVRELLLDLRKSYPDPDEA